MGVFDIFKPKKNVRQRGGVYLATGESWKEFIQSGYHTLDTNPEVVSGCYKIAQLIASMTIYLMANTEKGDKRIINELSRKIDISPCRTMTRSTWMTAIVMNMLLYGTGNAIVYPHTENGLLGDLEPISAHRVGFSHIPGTAEYFVKIDNVEYDPADLLHFVFKPDPEYMWKGRGFRLEMRSLVDTLSQAEATTNQFMQSKWKPSIIVKVDALVDEFSSPDGRRRLMDEYISTSKAGEPWLIPAEQFSVEQVKPLSLSDLALNDSVTLSKKTVAALLGVPPFVLGVGDYKSDEWDSFVNNTIRPIAQSIEQELTKKLLLSNKMYLMFNMSKLYSYDLQKTSAVYSGLYDKGIVTGNEVREKIGMQPTDGLDELLVLENYIPVADAGNQKKLVKEEG